MTAVGLVLLVSVIVVLTTAGMAAIWLWKPQKYFTWFLLHCVVGIYGISAVIVLALLNHLSSAAAAILSSIVAYTLGASAHSSRAAQDGQSSAGGSAGQVSGNGPDG